MNHDERSQRIVNERVKNNDIFNRGDYSYIENLDDDDSGMDWIDPCDNDDMFTSPFARTDYPQLPPLHCIKKPMISVDVFCISVMLITGLLGAFAMGVIVTQDRHDQETISTVTDTRSALPRAMIQSDVNNVVRINDPDGDFDGYLVEFVNGGSYFIEIGDCDPAIIVDSNPFK